jgi:hypothetical protein
MLTVKALCAEMAASGRHLSQRGARDWWTKGLLPKPARRSLGREKGTETYWTDPSVLRRAQAAYDLMAWHARTDIACWGLWLLGFPISLGAVRATYGKLIGRRLRSVQGRAGRLAEDVIGGHAASAARGLAQKLHIPVSVRHDLTDMLIPFLDVYFGVDDEATTEGLAKLWETVAPYLSLKGADVGRLAELHLTDDDWDGWVQSLKEFGSLPAQRETLQSASDYELQRARRLVLFVVGHLRRLAKATGPWEGSEEGVDRLVIAIGGWSIPILVAVLRNEGLRHKTTSLLLKLAQKLSAEGGPTPRRAKMAASPIMDKSAATE